MNFLSLPLTQNIITPSSVGKSYHGDMNDIDKALKNCAKGRSEAMLLKLTGSTLEQAYLLNKETSVPEDTLDEFLFSVLDAELPEVGEKIKVVEAFLGFYSDRKQNLPHDLGITALNWAASNNEVALLRKILRAGVDPNVTDEDGNTSLHFACKYSENIGTVKALLKAGADPNKTNDDGDTPLHWVCHYFRNYEVPESIEIVKALLGAKANPNILNLDSCAPLNLACVDEENIEIVDALLMAGADPDNQDKGFNENKAPLHWCIQYNREGLIKKLLEAGARLDVYDEKGKSPMSYMNSSMSPAVRSLLKEVALEQNVGFWARLCNAICLTHS